MESSVDEHPYTEFNCSNYQTPGKTSEYQTVGFHIYVYQVNKQECYTAGYSHRPVSITSGYNFNKAVNDGTETKNRDVFSEFSHSQY